ncbi:MAG: hypothetical protein FWC66_05095 [Oscillospiraceae bacterium]|nr:hypothetical protein [Oscillospiraceae bacterium]
MAIRRPTTRGGWKAPPVGSKARGNMPRSAFLKPGVRKYPYKVMRGGRWVASEKGLMAAYRRANQQRDRATAQAALRRLNPMRKKQGKKTLPLSK